MDDNENDLEVRLNSILLDSEEIGGESRFNGTEDCQDDMLISSEDDCETDVEESIQEEDIWSEAIKKPDRWPFADTYGVGFDAIVGCNEPIDFYRLYRVSQKSQCIK